MIKSYSQLSTAKTKMQQKLFPSPFSTDLIGALEKGSTGKKNKFLKAVFRRAVELQYDQSKAEARLAATVSGQYEITESCSVMLTAGTPAQISVKFAKGSGSRGKYEDTVELLSEEKVKAVVGMLIAENGLAAEEEDEERGGESAREMLKPVNMVKCSPRVFWNLVRLYGPNLPATFVRLFPQHDWSFLEGRRKVLSEKAMNNKRQARDAKLEAEEKRNNSKRKNNEVGEGEETQDNNSVNMTEEEEEDEESGLEFGRRYDLPTPFNFKMPEEILSVLSVDMVCDRIRACVPSETYTATSHYVPDSSFSMILNETDMDLPADIDIDKKELDLFYLIPECIEELKQILFESILSHILSIPVNIKQLSCGGRNSAKNKKEEDKMLSKSKELSNIVNEILKKAKINNFMQLQVWRLTPHVLVGMLNRAKSSLGHETVDEIEFTDDIVLEMANLAYTFCGPQSLCPWAKIINIA